MKLSNWLIFFIVYGFSGPIAVSEAGKFNGAVDVGQLAPEWGPLLGTDGELHSMSEFNDAKVVVVIFTCNHCPVAKAYEDRLLILTEQFQEKGVKFVAISVSRLESDQLPEMKKRAAKKRYQFPYIHDRSQKAGKAYGATVTPQVFVLNQRRKISYMGKFDDSIHDDRVSESFLRNALIDLLAGKEPEVTETKPVGCSIRYE